MLFQHQLDESIDLLERALKRTTQSSFIHHQLALCYKRKKIAEQSHKPFSNQSTLKHTACLKAQLSPNSEINHDFWLHRSGAVLEAFLYS